MIIACLVISLIAGMITSMMIDLMLFNMRMSHQVPLDKDSWQIVLLKFFTSFAISLPLINFIVSN